MPLKAYRAYDKVEFREVTLMLTENDYLHMIRQIDCRYVFYG